MRILLGTVENVMMGAAVVGIVLLFLGVGLQHFERRYHRRRMERAITGTPLDLNGYSFGQVTPTGVVWKSLDGAVSSGWIRVTIVK